MRKDLILSGDEIISLTLRNDYGSAALKLFEQQNTSWKQLSEGYDSLKTVRVKEFYFDGFKFYVQYNPGRIVSSSARVDPQSINNRKCFLCIQNLPEQQRAISYNDDYLILCNPFPIFPKHFTIPHVKHKPQSIKESFDALLALTREMSKQFTVFYNGPKCGASAPDHLHFQAGSKFFMPLDNEFQSIKNEYGSTIVESDKLTVEAIDDGLRRFYSFESNEPEQIVSSFNLLYKILLSYYESEEEPMMNILSFYEDEFGWRVIVFPRKRHRSSHYFAEGENHFLISAASVDLGGVIITPLEKDFERINEKIIREIFEEIIMDKAEAEEINKEFSKKTSRTFRGGQ